VAAESGVHGVAAWLAERYLAGVQTPAGST
jgi:hypothetical protein